MTNDVDKLVAELFGAPAELFVEDRGVDLVRRAATALRTLSKAAGSALGENPDYKDGFEAGYKAALRAFSMPDVCAIAKAICRSYGEEPDDLAPRERKTTADNHQVPCWRVYEEQARAVADLFPKGRPLAFVKPLEWRKLESGEFVASAPLFGNIRVEKHGEAYGVSWSAPGYSADFVKGKFACPEKAQEAGEAEYQRRMGAAFSVDTASPSKAREASFNSLSYGARFRYREGAPDVWVKIGHDTIAKWDAEKVSDTWIGQTVCSFADDGDLSVAVILVPDSGSSVPSSLAPVTTADLAELLSAAGPGPWEVAAQNGDPEESFRGICSPRRTNSRGKEYQMYVAQYCSPEIASLISIAPQLASEVLFHRSRLPAPSRADVIEEAAGVLGAKILEYEDYYSKNPEMVAANAHLAAVAALTVGASDIRALLSKAPTAISAVSVITRK